MTEASARGSLTQSIIKFCDETETEKRFEEDGEC